MGSRKVIKLQREENKMEDKDGTILKVGDLVRNKYGYDLIVSIDSDGDYFGKLVCDEHDSCKNIPYALHSPDIVKISNNPKQK